MEVDKIVLHKLLKDISRFEEDFSNDLNGAFEKQFSPEVDIRSVSDFFSLVRATVKKHYPKLA